MKISIITVVYNNASTLEEAVQSVISQTYPDLEYIVIDGNSTDGSVDIIGKYEKSISQWVSEPDNGMYHALNKGIAMATGDVIGLLHSDDLFENAEVLEDVAALFVTTGCDAVYGDLLYVSKDDPHRIIRTWKSEPFFPKLLHRGWMPAHPTLFIRKEWYSELGLFDITYKVAADYELILRFLGSGKLYCQYLPKVITRMRVGGKSNKSIKNIIRKSKEDYQSIRRYNAGGLKTLFLKNLLKFGQFFR